MNDIKEKVSNITFNYTDKLDPKEWFLTFWLNNGPTQFPTKHI